MRLKLKVKPNAKEEKVLGFDKSGALNVCVKAPPVEGKANRALIRLLSSFIGIPKNKVKIVSGLHSKLKVVEIEGESLEDFKERLIS
jgi:hypothetical protein